MDRLAKAVEWADGVPDDWNPDDDDEDDDEESSDGQGNSNSPWGDDETPF
ncbi:hypothetical protein IU459_34955 [Nocardia amamiensis]|uniref:Uncharacterized protein n=1 Tax=Nocardia amamiensis TaxID=404578 RepID=A0ABS0D1L4_9NOCA|nr:hypothetical protein [Nocardia amamiensis]MBF6302694.1 hypothetical protein [Nocardia amamiensis]